MCSRHVRVWNCFNVRTQTDYRLPAVTSGLALEPDEQGVSGRDEVVLLHRFREGVAEGLDDPRVVRPGGVVERQGLAAVAVGRLDRGLDPVDSEAAMQTGCVHSGGN